jgi:plasmid stabilization system protein ParE
MSPSVVFRPIAKAEFEDAISWYESKREGLGQEFRLAVNSQIERIIDSPAQFARVRKHIRRALLHRFPYSIYFIPNETQVVILAIFHTRRAPQHFENRT